MTRETTIKSADGTFIWRDLVNPGRERLDALAKEYGLHKTSVRDCLQPEHLPKFERIGQTTFIILRAYDEQAPKEADNVQELTRKIAIFIGNGFILTIHRVDQNFLARLRQDWQDRIKDPCNSSADEILADIFHSIFHSFEPALATMAAQLEQSEMAVFGTEADHEFNLETGYYLKRGISVCKRILRHSMEITNKVSHCVDSRALPHFQDVRETLDNLLFQGEELHDNINSLLNLHLALASQKTNESSHRINEIMRVLTIFSVFFLPLNFITGMYGMNFDQMPLVHWNLGFPLLVAALIGIAIGTVTWFHRRGWLK